MDEPDDVWQECQLLKRHGQNACVIRLSGTGTVLLIGLQEPLDISRAALVSAIHPASGRVCLKGDKFDDCKIEVEWPLTGMGAIPPPVRFQRKHRNPIQRMKRKRQDH
jgi:hypothetical protein